MASTTFFDNELIKDILKIPPITDMNKVSPSFLYTTIDGKFPLTYVIKDTLDYDEIGTKYKELTDGLLTFEDDNLINRRIGNFNRYIAKECLVQIINNGFFITVSKSFWNIPININIQKANTYFFEKKNNKLKSLVRNDMAFSHTLERVDREYQNSLSHSLQSICFGLLNGIDLKKQGIIKPLKRNLSSRYI